jgi:Lambda phage tail tube protein, TTP
VPTLAISAFGIQLRLGDGTPLAPLTLTAASNTTPIVVTTSAPHGVVDLTVGTITGVGGNLAANGIFILERTGANTLKLRRSIGTGAYTSGGSLVINSTYATVAEVTNIEDLGATAQLVDVTAHDAASAWGSKIPTFLSTGNMRVSLNHVPAHPTHNHTTGLWELFETRARRPILIVLPNGTGAARAVWYMTAATTGWSEGLPVNGALTAQVNLEGMGDLVFAVT